MRGAKGLIPRGKLPPVSIGDIVPLFVRILEEKHSKEDLELLLPGKFIQESTLQEIIQVYQVTSFLLGALDRGDSTITFGYASTDTETSFLDQLSAIDHEMDSNITTFDILYFFKLHESVVKNNIPSDTVSKKLLDICLEVRDQWLNDIASWRL